MLNGNVLYALIHEGGQFKMVDDLTEKVQGSQSGLEQLINKIPGFRGYRQKEQRRDADKLLRTYVARQYEEQLKRLGEAQYQLSSLPGGLRHMSTLERASMKLQLLIDRLKTASYGYAGLFDAIKVDEKVLDKLYDFDRGMLAGVEQLSAAVGKLADAVEAEGAVAPAISDLSKLLEALNTTFSSRQDIILKS
jgi:hypothetical protein